MKPILFLLFLFSCLMPQKVSAQRDKPDTAGCAPYSLHEIVVQMEFYLKTEEDSVVSGQKMLTATSGKTLVLYGTDEILRPVIENGLLNDRYLLQNDFTTTNMACLRDQSGFSIFVDADLTIAAESEIACILFFSVEMISDNAHQRVFAIHNSYCPFDGKKVFYLILQNDQKTNYDSGFLEGAYIRCLKYWYSII